jgi:deoxyribodipyrimidine photolyase-related protein
MILGNWALQRGFDPEETTQWFTRAFIDGYPWVMAANVAGMALYADGGTMATKPYAAGGAYIRRMSNYCGECRYRPDHRVGDQACPFTAGYWWFMDRNKDLLAGNARVAQPLRGLERLSDRAELVAQEEARGDGAP